jgi:polar amino acid transport system substrate-binding protein
LTNGQIDALVLDLPTAFFVTAAEIEGSRIVGQLPPGGDAPEQFGLVLDKDSPLTDCVSQAVEALEADGTLEDIELEWLAESAGAPVLE